MAGRVNIGGRSGGSGSSRSEGMSQQDKIKVGAAAGILLLGGLWICYYMDAFSFLQPKSDPNVPTLDGKPVPPEKVEEFQKQQREYKKANEEHEKEVGPPTGS